MAKVNVYNLKREKVGSVDLADDVFGAEVNEAAALRRGEGAARFAPPGTAKTKGRAEVAARRSKLYQQKGTGRARHGAIRAPHYVGGGKAHGPSRAATRTARRGKMRQARCKSALSLKLKEGSLTVVDKLRARRDQDQGLAGVLERCRSPQGR